MLWRLWFVLSIGWAACVIGSEVANGHPVDSKVMMGATGPLVLGLIIRNVGRYVVTGSLHRQRR